MCPWRPVFFGASSRFLVQGYRSPRHFKRAGQTPNDTVGPSAQVCLERVPVHVPKDGVERGGTGGAMGEAEGLGDPRALIASPFGNGTIDSVVSQNRNTRQREYGCERT